MAEKTIVRLPLSCLIAWARASGSADIDKGRPATTATLFQAASISKPVAAASMLSMAEEGHIAFEVQGLAGEALIVNGRRRGERKQI